jgi:hypothetical protein
MITDDGAGSTVSRESNELRRGAGSFILHGKKASVITMSGEWQAMSNEERLRLRREHPPAEEEKKDEDAIEEGAVSQVSGSRRGSMLESLGSGMEEREEEDFVDAKTSVDGQRMSVFVDAKETRSRDSRDVGDLEEEESDEEEEEEGRDIEAAKVVEQGGREKGKQKETAERDEVSDSDSETE